jgi:hypothetical protein
MYPQHNNKEGRKERKEREGGKAGEGRREKKRIENR